MDEGTQQTVIGFGLVAAAAGPVLSVTGRITKGVGSMVTAFGRAKQDVATYADALTTTNVASLKAYQGNEKLSKALEKNPAAKAAGGVQKYIDAVTEANTAQSRYNASVRDLEREQKKGSKANSELVESLQKEVSERKSAMDAAKGTVEGYKASATAAQASTTAVTAQSVAMKAASVAATGLKLALATIAPLAIIAGITALVGVFQEAKEHEDNLKAATEGLTAATEKGVSASNAGADALEGYGASARCPPRSTLTRCLSPKPSSPRRSATPTPAPRPRWRSFSRPTRPSSSTPTTPTSPTTRRRGSAPPSIR